MLGTPQEHPPARGRRRQGAGAPMPADLALHSETQAILQSVLLETMKKGI